MPKIAPHCPLKSNAVRSTMLVGLLVAAGSAQATTWLGGQVSTQGFGVSAGKSLLRVPLIGALGVEGTLEKTWRTPGPRYALGLTLRDLNLPLTRVDAFGTLGAEYLERINLYAEGGVRGPLLGPAGWRAFVRGNSAMQFGAGVGVELRF